MRGLVEFNLSISYLEKCSIAVRSWARQPWVVSGWSPTVLPMLPHTTASKCWNSWSSATGVYKLIIVQIPGISGLKPLWHISASPLGARWVRKTMVKFTGGQICWKLPIPKAAEAGLEPQFLGRVVIWPCRWAKSCDLGSCQVLFIFHQCTTKIQQQRLAFTSYPRLGFW